MSSIIGSAVGAHGDNAPETAGYRMEELERFQEHVEETVTAPRENLQYQA